ncbi:beta,beta-carotene 15,15'-dioxygenase-like [Portunus trituberculatus]|uniref:beta,beta-carotene 15,15'-dioxygenase-like n=1 Tax=Portunus trituberculatus TaxID=210409 RepID=UPI001E1D13D4|nr:beta,beta-carotene 15,15'-dioxygenase-like [Portunus trituberculatus]XP_045113372.1 beta,beta-carotene 15,15'-dioxygenase-like [Portunus trituberculatus]
MSALIHQFNIYDGRVTYQSRFLQGDTYKKNLKANRIVVSEFGTGAYPDPYKTLFQRFMSFFTPLQRDVTDNCLVSVCHFGDELYAMTETNVMRRIDPETLETVGEKTNLDEYLIAVNTATAHPHVDPDGTVYNMGSSFAAKGGPQYYIVKFPPPAVVDGKKKSSLDQAKVVSNIPCEKKLQPSYYHSFGITENYFIFVEQPYVLNLKNFLLNAFLGKSFLASMEWHSKKKTKFHVVRRDTGEMIATKYASDAFLTFHHTNAYEEDGHLVVDLCAIKSGEVISQFLLKNLSQDDFKVSPSDLPHHRRYVLPLHTEGAHSDTNLVTLKGTKCTARKIQNGTIFLEGQDISPNIIDLPRINYKYNGKPYTFAYGVEVNPLGMQFSRLVKMNMRTGETQLWHEDGKLVSEPVFLAAPDATREEEGVVLTTLLDKNNPTFVALLVLDPTSWKEVARVEFKAQGKVTQTFHGQFAATGDNVHLL